MKSMTKKWITAGHTVVHGDMTHETPPGHPLPMGRGIVPKKKKARPGRSPLAHNMHRKMQFEMPKANAAGYYPLHGQKY